MKKSVEFDAIILLNKIRHPALYKYNLTEADKRAVAFILEKNGLNSVSDYVTSLSLSDFEKFLKTRF